MLNTQGGRQSTAGFAAVIVATMIWSSWTVVSKLGISADLGAQDLAAIRFAVSGLISVPIVLWYKPFRTLRLYQILGLAATGGVPYVLLLYFGFTFAPASHAGVLVNGIVPAITIAYRNLITKTKPRRNESFGALAILAGVIMVVGVTVNTANIGYVVGDGLFIAAAFLFAGFLTLNSKWKAGPSAILLSLSLTGAMIYLPVWWLFLPKTLTHVQLGAIVLQFAYQGLLAPIAGMLLISFATVRCGSVIVATVLSSVPILSALMAALWLGETVSVTSWCGISITTVGILVTIVARDKPLEVPSLSKETAR